MAGGRRRWVRQCRGMGSAEGRPVSSSARHRATRVGKEREKEGRRKEEGGEKEKGEREKKRRREGGIDTILGGGWPHV